MALHWYVVHVQSGHETKIEPILRKVAEHRGLLESFGRVLVPTEEVIEMRGGQKRKSERRFYPGYILVEIDMTDEVWHLVKSVPKVLGFIGGRNEKPAPISNKEADLILRQITDNEDKPKPKVLFDVNEMVRVTDGPFADFNGTVEDVNYEKSRLKVAVVIFGRSTPVELRFDQVEKA